MLDVLEQDFLKVTLLSMRIAPVFIFAPPFNLIRIPVAVRGSIAIILAIWMSSISPESFDISVERDFGTAALVELFRGLMLTLTFQMTFAALQFVGRMTDLQAGFSLALLADPTLRSQMPLIGSILIYAAGIVFFTTGGDFALIASIANSTLVFPLGEMGGKALDAKAVGSFFAASTILAMGILGVVTLTLFLIDVTIALISRTLPQMNVLILGFQVKAMATLLVLPIALALAGTLFARLLNLALNSNYVGL